MNHRSTCALLLAMSASFLSGCLTEPKVPAFSEVDTLPTHPEFPNPLVLLDGRRVTTPEQWFKEGRPELQALFEHYMYGTLPPKPARLTVKVLAEYPDFLDGQALL